MMGGLIFGGGGGAGVDLGDAVFEAEISASVNDVTGNGASYTIIWNSEITAAAFASLNTGTGEVTLDGGLYWVDMSAVLTGGSGTTRGDLKINKDGSIEKYVGVPGETGGINYFNGGAVVQSAGTGKITTTIRLYGAAGNTADLSATTSQTKLRIVKLA